MFILSAVSSKDSQDVDKAMDHHKEMMGRRLISLSVQCIQCNCDTQLRNLGKSKLLNIYSVRRVNRNVLCRYIEVMESKLSVMERVKRDEGAGGGGGGSLVTA